MNLRWVAIPPEYQPVVFLRDDKGGEYVCYTKDISDRHHVKESEKENCIETSLVMGPNW